MPKIRQLPEHIIKQIAAGEIIERPASVIKELIENSIDANAKNIEISIRNGGKSFISVLDDGTGIAKDDLANCIKKHTTSKLNDDDLYNIQTMGFRGEALSSVCYVGKLTIKSKEEGSSNAFELYAENDNISEVNLSNLTNGTYIELRDLFFNIPARLKFLKSDISEAGAIYKVVNQIALAHPNITFRVYHNAKKVIDYKVNSNLNISADYYESFKEALIERTQEIINKDFIKNSYFIYKPSAEFVIYGYIGIPSFTTTQSSHQYIYVNKRFVKTSFLFGAIKAAYAGVIEKARYPMVVLFIDINPQDIDVNVSPSKTEIKFKDTELIRNLLVGTLKNTLADSQNQKTASGAINKLFNNESRTPSHESIKAMNDLLSNENNNTNYQWQEEIGGEENTAITESKPYSWQLKEENYGLIGKNNNKLSASISTASADFIEESTTISPHESQAYNEDIDLVRNNLPKDNNLFEAAKLGYAKAQYHKNWIIAENKTGFVIIDQHAAHERINQEKLYKQYINNAVTTQMTLLPEVIEVAKNNLEILHNFKHCLLELGLNIDVFGDSAIIIREYPSILGDKVNFKQLINDIIVDLKSINSPECFKEKLSSIITSMACHSSIRSGDNMSLLEMNNLLREIEVTENASQCPHGRPTYILLSLSDIEKLFKRK